ASAAEVHDVLERVAHGRSVKRTRSLSRRLAVFITMSLTFGLIATIIALSIASVRKNASRPNPEAAQLYERGRWYEQQLTDDSLKKAIADLNQAIRIDHGYVPAYSALFRIYMWNAPGVSVAERFQKLSEIAGQM